MAIDLLSPTPFSDGSLSTTEAALLYLTPAGKTVMLKSVTLVNTLNTKVKVNFYIDRIGTNRRILPKDLIIQPLGSIQESDVLFVLKDGDTVRGHCNIAAAVDYTMSGAIT